MLIYVSALLFIPQLQAYTKLLWIGLFQIFFNLFTIEWYYRGIEEFKYITYRTVGIRIIYIILIFTLVTDESHYIRYYYLSILIVIFNGVINWVHSKKNIRLTKQSLPHIFSYWKPFASIGLQIILLSYHSTINPILLGLLSNDSEVGYYTTASKLALIILMFYNAYTLVLIPRVSSLVGNDNQKEANNLINWSFSILYIIAIPLIYIIEVYTPELILFIAGSGYEGAILPMRISLPVILIGGISQISINQILIPYNSEKGSTIASIIGITICILLNILLIPIFKSIASAAIWITTESIIVISIYLYIKKYLKDISFSLVPLVKYLFLFIPIFGIAFLKTVNIHFIIQIVIACIILLGYCHICLKFILRDKVYIYIYNKLFHNNT